MMNNQTSQLGRGAKASCRLAGFSPSLIVAVEGGAISLDHMVSTLQNDAVAELAAHRDILK